MPRKDVILNLPGFILKKVTNYSPMILEVEYKGKMECVYCQSKKLRKKDKFIRRVKHETVGLRTTVLEFVAHKYYCRSCQRYFNGRYPGIIKYQRASEKLEDVAIYQEQWYY